MSALGGWARTNDKEVITMYGSKSRRKLLSAVLCVTVLWCWVAVRAEAFDIVETVSPNLVLFDHHFNPSNIREFLDKTYNNSINVPIIVVGADESNNEMTAAFKQMGAYDYLQGRQDYKRLEQIVNRIKDEHGGISSQRDISSFFAEDFAASAAQVVAANGIKVYLCPRAMPTPVISYGVRAQKAGGAIIITASHNPGMWNGFKYKSEDGASAPPEVTVELEKNISRILDTCLFICLFARSSGGCKVRAVPVLVTNLLTIAHSNL